MSEKVSTKNKKKVNSVNSFIIIKPIIYSVGVLCLTSPKEFLTKRDTD